MRNIFVLCLLLVPFAAHAVCDPGQYLLGGECVSCVSGYYCPGDGTRVRCPDDTVDWAAEYTDEGYTVYDVYKQQIWSHSYTDDPSDCHTSVYITVAGGQFYIEPVFKDTRYVHPRTMFWYSAEPGYYLSQWRQTSWKIWYHGVQQCTNAPEYAHYTGAGTPDAPDGSITDANDCPWECDDGYGWHDDECVPLCAAGVRYIKTGGGLTVNLYPIRYSSPALHVRNNGAICYGVLAQGSAQNAININVAGKIYHTEN